MNKPTFLRLGICLLGLWMNPCVTTAIGTEASHEVVEVIDVDRVPADFRTRFDLLTAGDYQFAAYYNADRQMTVAMRRLGETTWKKKVLPSKVGVDSHNYVTMVVDSEGHLHVSGNMHVDELVYFRASEPWDIDSLKAHPMTGELENRVTYPHFVKDAEGNLLFHYRHGGSGNGMRIWNRYDPSNKTWSRWIDTPLFDGQGKMNAYPSGFRRGPDGWFHVMWVWRDTPDCATNHHLSYMRSKDLKHWESAAGHKATLPITINQDQLWVDPAPAGSGMINGGQRLAFDTDNQPVIVYHKADASDHMQIYAARPQGEDWQRKVLTDWNREVHFSGGGSMPFIGIRIGTLTMPEPGLFTIDYRHKDYGAGRLFFRESDLEIIESDLGIPREFPQEMNRKLGTFDGLAIRRTVDRGEPEEADIHYVLQWESLGSNRDRPHEPPLPEPSKLRLFKLRAVGDGD